MYVVGRPGAGKTGAAQMVRRTLIELTPSSAAGFVAGAALYRQAGYRVELVVLAVRAADSRQGTAARYAKVSRRGVPARFTTAAGHDSCYSVLPEVVATAERLAVVDEVLVMRRDAHSLYRNTLGGHGRWARRRGAALAGRRGRERADRRRPGNAGSLRAVGPRR